MKEISESVVMDDAMDIVGFGKVGAGGGTDQLDELAEAIAGIRVRETSADSLVTVTLDERGTLLELVLAPGISELAPNEFERLVVATCAVAARTAFAEYNALLDSFSCRHVVE
ncbi:YbaB/EbfC family nucleoid-associated protein [Nocardia sp. NBC_00511]|uniref:YbaB/EbfC family nucleoid-associated protein n=1 Tax=Nocardia sp. NBC_00511 TaxID=2903591 RepID=UPI002F907AF5